jgi:hypothetical protein
VLAVCAAAAAAVAATAIAAALAASIAAASAALGCRHNCRHDCSASNASDPGSVKYSKGFEKSSHRMYWSRRKIAYIWPRSTKVTFIIFCNMGNVQKFAAEYMTYAGHTLQHETKVSLYLVHVLQLQT